MREALARRARLVELWAPASRLFAASVHVCVPVLEVGKPGRADWARLVARARGVPVARLRDNGEVRDQAEVVAGFRDEYYGLAGHVQESTEPDPDGRLVTSGVIDLGRCRWGEHSVRFAKHVWERPVVDRDGVEEAGGRAAALMRRVAAPKALVATQTRVIEVAVDESGSWIPSTPVVSVIPHDPKRLWLIAAAIAAPPVVAWMLDRSAGTALQPGALRPTASLLAAVPLPIDETAWAAAADALRAVELDLFAEKATAAYSLPRATSQRIVRWWRGRLPAADHPGRWPRTDIESLAERG